MRQILYLLIFVLYKPSCEYDDDERPSSTSGGSTSPLECNENMLVQFLAEMEITNPESIIAMAVSNFENFCRDTYEHLEKFHKYIATCKFSSENDLYMRLIAGVRALRKKLCNTLEFSKSYELFYPCLHELKNDFGNCDGPVDWYEDKDKKEICKAYKHITDCYYIKAAKVCGLDAAKTFKGLTKDVVDSIINVSCKNVDHDPAVKDPMPQNYLCGEAKVVSNSIEFLTVLAVSRLYLL